MPKYSKKEREEAIAELRKLIDPMIKQRDKPSYHGDTHEGPTVLVKLDHVSRSGMMRKITPMLLVDCEAGDPNMRYLGRLPGSCSGGTRTIKPSRSTGAVWTWGFTSYILKHRWI